MKVIHRRSGIIYAVDFQTARKYHCIHQDTKRKYKFWKKDCAPLEGTGQAPTLVKMMKNIIVVE